MIQQLRHGKTFKFTICKLHVVAELVMANIMQYYFSPLDSSVYGYKF